jgi:magnesium-transporting ATPase (P-type)
MTKKPFDINEIMFDFLLSAGTFIIAGIICISIVTLIMPKGSLEEGLEISTYVAIPLGTIIFYVIRRRFRLLVTLIQIIFSIGLTFAIGYLSIKFTVDNIGLYLALILPCITFVLTKHSVDSVILKKSADTLNT